MYLKYTSKRAHIVLEFFTSLRNIDRINQLLCAVIGTWPSGKAPGFGPGIRRFESCRPSQEEFSIFLPRMPVIAEDEVDLPAY